MTVIVDDRWFCKMCLDLMSVKTKSHLWEKKPNEKNFPCCLCKCYFGFSYKPIQFGRCVIYTVYLLVLFWFEHFEIESYLILFTIKFTKIHKFTECCFAKKNIARRTFPKNFIEKYIRIPHYFMEFPIFSWNVMEFHQILWNFIQPSGIWFFEESSNRKLNISDVCFRK